MKFILVFILTLGTSFYAAIAQELDDSIELELDPAIAEEIKAETAPKEEDTIAPTVKAEAKQNRSIYIVNQASSGAKSDAKNKSEQVDTEIITTNKAEDLKKSRKRAEIETELKATEKIEESRLKDEQRRSEVLFGDRFKELENNENSNTNVNSNTNQVPVQVIAPQQTVTPAPPALGRDEIREELKSVLDEKEALEAVKKKAKGNSSSYFIGMIGISEYPKADNIQGNGVFGIGLGVEAQDKVLVEGMFQYASYRSNYIWLKDIEEYSGVGAVKVQFSKGSLRPLAGGLIVYSYRTYTDTYNNYLYSSNYSTRQSHVSAFDAGLLGGAQFVISEDFIIGGEFRYLWNLTSKTDGNSYYPAFFPNSEPLDSLSHYSFAITGRFNF